MRRAVPEGNWARAYVVRVPENGEWRMAGPRTADGEAEAGASERVDQPRPLRVPRGGLLRGRDEAERRNQGDKRRVGPVMYDAQIRAIVPITVQIIAHELVASGVAATPSNRLRRRRMPGSPFGYGLVDDPLGDVHRDAAWYWRRLEANAPISPG